MANGLISIDEARALVLRATKRLAAEPVEIQAALDRVLAEPVLAVGNVPPFACSAMDGYAVQAGAAGRTLSVAGESRAGAPSGQSLDEGEAIRISTGAAVPAGATAVIKQEDVDQDQGSIRTNAAVAQNENIRPAGEDMAAGSTVLRAGTRLGAAELGAAVAAGAGHVEAVARPRVQILCTGDELRAPGEPLGPGEIHNSNAPMLVAVAQHLGAVTAPAIRLGDDREATVRGLAEALEHSDVLIISGGVSVGPHDHVKPALAALGVEEHFWGVALQPGKPTWFGTQDGKLVFGLPGNPVSTLVTFALFAMPAINALQGAHVERFRTTEAVLARAVRLNPRREQALRVRLQRQGESIVATPNGPQGSNIVTSLIGADALARIPVGSGELEAGAMVVLEPLPD